MNLSSIFTFGPLMNASRPSVFFFVCFLGGYQVTCADIFYANCALIEMLLEDNTGARESLNLSENYKYYAKCAELCCVQ